jgi:hypothetical protein
VAVLTHPISWRRAAKRDVSTDLTSAEQEHVRAALHFLAKRFGDYTKLAKAMKTPRETVQRPALRGATVTAGVALRASRVARVPLEDILSGAWPRPGTCPHCGRG